MLALATALLLAAGPAIGDPAPHLELPTLGGPVLTGQQLGGQVTVIDLFATWCLPCRRSLADLTAVRRALGPRVHLVILAVEGDTPVLRAYFQAHPPPEGATVAFASADLERRWGADRLPTTFFVDPALVVRHINRGHGPGFRDRATRWLSAMLPPRT
jgi:cytochrome c biogenesis protein CcmG/thiol:disulfide interchange protein DsbE